jgi:hypothetical protein
MLPQKQPNSVTISSTATIPELQQSKTAVLNNACFSTLTAEL